MSLMSKWVVVGNIIKVGNFARQTDKTGDVAFFFRTNPTTTTTMKIIILWVYTVHVCVLYSVPTDFPIDKYEINVGIGFT